MSRVGRTAFGQVAVKETSACAHDGLEMPGAIAQWYPVNKVIRRGEMDSVLAEIHPVLAVHLRGHEMVAVHLLQDAGGFYMCVLEGSAVKRAAALCPGMEILGGGQPESPLPPWPRPG